MLGVQVFMYPIYWAWKVPIKAKSEGFWSRTLPARQEFVLVFYLNLVWLQKFKRIFGSNYWQKMMVHLGFNKRSTRCENGIFSQLSARNVVNVLQYWVQSCASQDLFANYECSSANFILHCINANIGKFVCTTAEKVAVHSKDKNVLWRE